MPLAVFPKCYIDALCTDRTMTVEQWVDLAQQVDVDGLEMYWNFTPETAQQRRELRRRVEDQGRSIPMMCYSPDFTKPDAVARREEVEKEKRVLDASADLGVRFCRVLSGQSRPELRREAAIGWVAECIHGLLPCAAGHGITLILENHYKDGFWQHTEFAQRMEIFLPLLDAIGRHPNFGVNYDPSNTLICGEDPIELLDRIKDRVVTMHASDRYLENGSLADLKAMDAQGISGYAKILKHGVIGKGLNDYDRIFSILHSAGFAGWVSIEDGSEPEGGLERLVESADFLRAKMRQHGV